MFRRSTEFSFANPRSEEQGGEEEGVHIVGMFLTQFRAVFRVQWLIRNLIIVAFINVLHLADRLRFRSPIQGGRGMAVQ